MAVMAMGQRLSRGREDDDRPGMKGIRKQLGVMWFTQAGGDWMALTDVAMPLHEQ